MLVNTATRRESRLMTIEEPINPEAYAEQTREWLEPLRDRSIWFSVAILYVIGLLIAGSPDSFRDPSQYVLFSLCTFLLGGLVLILRQWRHPVAAGALVIGTSAIGFAAATWGGVPEATWLLLMPLTVTTLTAGPRWGATLTTIFSLGLAFAPSAIALIPVTTRVVTGIGMWTVVGSLWVTVSALLSPLHWAWTSYEHNRLRLAQALDRQVKLHEMAEDLTEANLQLNRLNRLAQALRQTAEDERAAKEHFVANVSHELRTPLNMIIGFSEMITSAPDAYGENIPPALLADLNVVLRNSQHLSSLIDDVLDMSQIEVGQMALSKERASLAEIIHSAVTAVRPLFESKGLYLKTDIPEDLPLFMCDRTRVREVMLNLLSNAGRFTERGGVELEAHQQGNRFIVGVTDTGPGITEEHQARLFVPFEQLDTSIRRRYGGTGLGLSISKSFVELHEGEMWVESQVGQGTSFYFSLPIDPPAPLESTALRWFNPYQEYEERMKRPRAKAVPVRPRLVVVEGGDSLHRLLNRYLDGTEVVPVATLEEAFEEVAHTPTQVLLINDLDIGDALQRVRDSEALPYGMPAIVCTIPGAEQASDVLGVFDYLVKPISRQSLLSCLDKLETPPSKILLVDDEPDALQLFGRILSEAGRDYQVVRASNGIQALELLRRERPDVILLDLVMPGMDGFQLLNVKSKDPALAGIPVVLISARDPLGQPILSNSLAVTSRRGMSAREILACIEALTRILSSASSPADRVLTVEPRD